MPNKELYPTIKDCLSFKECQEAIVFHATNIKNAGYETSCLRNRVVSLKALFDLLLKYEDNADKIKLSQKGKENVK